jgi:hypothetical protein
LNDLVKEDARMIWGGIELVGDVCCGTGADKLDNIAEK